MSNLLVKDGASATKYLKATGAGTDVDPNVPEHLESNSGDILNALGDVASATNQATELASLASIDGKTPVLGQALEAASTPVVLTTAQIAALTPPAAITGFATDTGQGAMTETPPATDTASSGLNGRLQRIAQRLTSLIALIPASIGQKTKTTSLAVTLASDEDLIALHGTLTETAPATDTASSGLNGRLQRIAQRITSLIALLPAALTTLGNFKVSIQEQIIRTYTKTASTAASSGDNTLVAAPSAGNHLVIKDLIVQNESSTATTVILKDGATANWRALLAGNASLTLSFAEGEEWRLTTATALVLNLSGANSHGYSIRYRVEAD